MTPHIIFAAVECVELRLELEKGATEPILF